MNTTHSIFDPLFNGMPGNLMYRSWVIPELYPNHEQAPQPRFANWDPEEVELYCGRPVHF